MLCAYILCGTAKEKIVHLLDEAAGGEVEELKVLLESLSKEMRSRLDQVKAKKGWETEWSGIVRKASFSSNTVKNSAWGGMVER